MNWFNAQKIHRYLVYLILSRREYIDHALKNTEIHLFVYM